MGVFRQELYEDVLTKDFIKNRLAILKKQKERGKKARTCSNTKLLIDGNQILVQVMVHCQFFCQVKGFPFLDLQGSKIDESQARIGTYKVYNCIGKF